VVNSDKNISNRTWFLTSFTLLLLLLLTISCLSVAQTTNAVILDTTEIQELRQLITTNETVRQQYDSVAQLAEQYLIDSPRPLKVLHYEGLLESNPDRINTRKSLADIDKIGTLIYASYGQPDIRYARKMKEFLTEWVSTYLPTGNTINENKFCPLFWGYYLFRDQFTVEEKQAVEQWMQRIAQMQIDRPRTPNNNWQAKRMKIIGIVGCITQNQPMKDFALAGLKEYINTAYYADSTSRDLVQRDAMHYHISGLKPLLSAFINLSKFDPAFNLFNYATPQGASVEKSVAYVLPYATGKKVRKEWINSQVKLDHQRAAAGLEEYQPGRLFDPAEAIPLLEWAGYYHPEWYTAAIQSRKGTYDPGWVGILNSPLVREL